jgi:hypothetical protein
MAKCRSCGKTCAQVYVRQIGKPSYRVIGFFCKYCKDLWRHENNGS